MRRTLIALCLILAVGVVAAAVLISSGAIHLGARDTSARPPCAQLPSLGRVETALTQHADLMDRLKAVDPSVTVQAASPCDGAFASRGIVDVTYASGDQRARIDSILSSATGFGVPVEVLAR